MRIKSIANIDGCIHFIPGLGGFKETKMFLPHPRVKVSIVGSLCDREVACSASDRQGSNFESCVWRTVSSHSSHHPQEVLLAQFSLYVHKGGLKPDSFHFFCIHFIGHESFLTRRCSTMTYHEVPFRCQSSLRLYRVTYVTLELRLVAQCVGLLICVTPVIALERIVTPFFRSFAIIEIA